MTSRENHRSRRRPQWILEAAILAGWIGFLLCPERLLMQSKALVLAQSLSREVVKGHLNGRFQGKSNGADFTILEPGDILLCHNQGGGYGFWTHSAIYVGNGQVVDAEGFCKGTEVKKLESYRNYDDLEVLRLRGTSDVRTRIARRAIREIGKSYNPFSGITDTSSLYCSKLIWQTFSQEGILLCQTSTWVLPDDISQSTQLIQIGRWQATPSSERG